MRWKYLYFYVPVHILSGQIVVDIVINLGLSNCKQPFFFFEFSSGLVHKPAFSNKILVSQAEATKFTEVEKGSSDVVASVFLS